MGVKDELIERENICDKKLAFGWFHLTMMSSEAKINSEKDKNTLTSSVDCTNALNSRIYLEVF